MKVFSFYNLIFILFILLTGCSLTDINNQNLNENNCDEKKNTSAYFSIVSHYPADNSVDVEVGKSVEIDFNTEINTASLNNQSVRIIRIDNNEVIDTLFTLSSNRKKLYIKPIFKTYAVNSDIYTKGIRPDTQYKVIISKNITDINGRSLQSEKIITFKTRSIDYGIYWFDENGNSEKYIKNDPLFFYNNTKPVIIYAHGWQKSTSKKDYWREVPYIWNDKYSSNTNIGKLWKARNYNIGVFYWNQFADEDEVKDAEAKIWKGDNGLKQMRYRMINESYNNFSTSKSVHDLFYDCYIDALSNNTSGYIRFAGHSLGNQLVTALAYKISDSIYNKKISVHYMPKRIALLDPFWSKDGKTYLGGKWVGEVARSYIKIIIERDKVAVEQYKSTGIGGLVVGDENIDMRKLTAFYRIWPDFIPIQDAAIQHSYAVLWYFWSIEKEINGDYYKIGASVSDSSVKNMMNYGKSQTYYWYNEGIGTKTSTPLDDYFKRKEGVSTW